MEKTTVLAIVGPTASGKTKLGVDLSKKFNGEVVSCDSMQLYRGMDIATAKPTADEMRGIPHHLVDCVEPSEKYSVARYISEAKAAISDIVSRGRLPVLVGGTGLYVDSLLGGVRFSEEPQNELVREQLSKEAAEKGNQAMHDMLSAIDPEYAKTLHPNNLGRVLRAIELFRLTGKTMSEQLEYSKKVPSAYSPIMLGISYSDRELLYRRINLRVDIMLENGLIDEVRAFYERYDAKTAAQAIGCKEFLPYLNGEKTLLECTEKLKLETRRYAKRQLTWFRRNEDIHWLYNDLFKSYDELLEEAAKIVNSSLF